jgi:hypothetical protein
VDLKVYFGPFWSKDVLLKFRSLFNAAAVKKYEKWFTQEHLSRLALFCVRYNPKGKSIRTDFWVSTRRIAPYLETFDFRGEAQRLYKDLYHISQKQILTFICIDLDKRPRTQFYFYLDEI